MLTNDIIYIDFNKWIKEYFNPETFSLSTTKKKPKEENKIPPSLKPKKVYYNSAKNTVAVLWQDNTRTSVTCAKNDIFSIEEGFRAALARKVYGNYHNYSRYIDKAIDSGK